MAQPDWKAEEYKTHAAFVPNLATDVVGLLNPQAHERILDLGCGDGALTAKLCQYGCQVIGVDASADMVATARERGLEVYQMDGQALGYQAEFAAVFSNAALHWMLQPEQVVQGVYKALQPGGRLVAECGGAGNIAALWQAITEVFAEHPEWGALQNPWYFPSVAEYSDLLERAGFQVETIGLIPRPTPVSSGIVKWLEIFADGMIRHLDAQQQQVFLHNVSERLKPVLYSEADGWVVDYVRLRFRAVKS